MKQPYEQQSSVGMVQPGPGFGYNQAHFQPGHGPQHAVMMRQKSIGNDSCYYYLFLARLVNSLTGLL